jgi:hypothetical protein
VEFHGIFHGISWNFSWHLMEFHQLTEFHEIRFRQGVCVVVYVCASCECVCVCVRARVCRCVTCKCVNQFCGVGCGWSNFMQ